MQQLPVRWDKEVRAAFAHLDAQLVCDAKECSNQDERKGSSDPSILLTGASGFLGAFLLDALLRQCPDRCVHITVHIQTHTHAGSRPSYLPFSLPHALACAPHICVSLLLTVSARFV